jgi:GT2 family glycosyltransferase
VVELLGDGESLGLFKAETFVRDLYDQGFGDGCHGHYLALERERDFGLLELVLANDGRVLASLRLDRQEVASAAELTSFGRVMWRGGLRLSGHLNNYRHVDDGRPPLLAFEGSTSLPVETNLLPAADNASLGVQFDIMLPPSLADGEAHILRVTTHEGVELDGSPVTVFAQSGGYQAILESARQRPSSRPLARKTLQMLDALLPASMSLTQFPDWREAFGADRSHDAAASITGTLAIIIVGRAASEATIASLREQLGPINLKVAVLDTTDSPLEFEQSRYATICRTLAEHEPDGWLVVRAGTLLRPIACATILRTLKPTEDGATATNLCLSDYESFDSDGAVIPLFWPVFDYERLLSQGYGEGFCAFRKAPAVAEHPAGTVCTFDLLLAGVASLHGDVTKVAHVPTLLASVPRVPPAPAATLLAAAVERHLSSAGVPAIVETKNSSVLPLVTIRRSSPAMQVGIIVPTRDRLDLLKPCIESIRRLTVDAEYRLTIVDNGSREQETLDYLDELREGGVTVWRDERPFNYARLNNEAVERLDTPLVCFLNNDVEVSTPAWLSTMQSYLARPDVAAVGAKLLWPNGMLQHGGVVIGLNYAAGHAYDRYLASEAGYADGILTARECSALTAACLMVRRSDFIDVGGFDEQAFPVTFNDVDLCLKLRRAGKVLVWTPEAELLHHESASRQSDFESIAKRSRADKELAELRQRWGRELMADPYYNPNLNLDAYPFTALAMPPRKEPIPRRRAT